jgi:hypothetical protein
VPALNIHDDSIALANIQAPRCWSLLISRHEIDERPTLVTGRGAHITKLRTRPTAVLILGFTARLPAHPTLDVTNMRTGDPNVLINIAHVARNNAAAVHRRYRNRSNTSELQPAKPK